MVFFVAALFASASAAFAAEPDARGRKETTNVEQPALDKAVAEFQRKLEEYSQARKKYEDEASAYWMSVAEKRRMRNAKRRNNEEVRLDDYVLTQPPVYSGPPRPSDPSPVEQEKALPAKKYVPVVADFLKAAAEHFDFVPQRPRSEMEYKRAYASAAKAAGLTKDQVVRIYAFEIGGNGTYDVQAGLEYPKPDARAISTALGYNQLLNTNSVELMAEQGDKFIKTLQKKAEGLTGPSKSALQRKIAVVQRMVAFSRTVPDSWSEHEKLANTPQGLGIHAMNLDLDVGPLLQTQKLLDSVVFARKKGHKATLTAAELEMMNLTGDGNGLDMVRMPAALRAQVPTANFFQQKGYEVNSIAIRNNVVAALLAETDAKMDREAKLQGAKDLMAAF